jgi:hypothetical protein
MKGETKDNKIKVRRVEHYLLNSIKDLLEQVTDHDIKKRIRVNNCTI